MTRTERLLIPALCTGLLALTGCKKEESTTDPADNATEQADDQTGDDHSGASHGHEEVPIGTATIGDMQVECAQGHGETAAGKEMHLIVKLPHNDAGETIVRAWIGTEDRLQSRVAKGTYAASHDDYDIHAPAPDPLPDGAMWWIEVEMPDGTTSVGSIAYK